MATKLTAYDSLLLKYKPRPIRNDRENRRSIIGASRPIRYDRRGTNPAAAPTCLFIAQPDNRLVDTLM
jgi:hypothetical protein